MSKFNVFAFTALATLAVGSWAVPTMAEDAPAAPPAAAAPATPAPDAPAAPKARRRGGNQFANIISKLDLTDAQKAQVDPIVKDAMEQIKTARKDNKGDRQAIRTKTQEITKATWDKISALLTDDQKVKLTDAQKKARRNGRRRRGAGANGGAAPATPPAAAAPAN
jgi:Spy/CpxP family protein refolding chaperone